MALEIILRWPANIDFLGTPFASAFWLLPYLALSLAAITALVWYSTYGTISMV